MDVLECLVQGRKPSDLFIKMSPFQFRLLFSRAVNASVRTERIYINAALLSLAEDTSLSNPALGVGARQFQRVLERFVGAQGN